MGRFSSPEREWATDEPQQSMKCESHYTAAMTRYIGVCALTAIKSILSLHCSMPQFPKAGNKESLAGNDTPTDSSLPLASGGMANVHQALTWGDSQYVFSRGGGA